MVSNPAEMFKWFSAMRDGRILQGEAQELYLRRRTAIGSSDRGFYFLHAWDSMIYVAMNAGSETRTTEMLTRGLIGLVASGGGE